MFTIFDHFSKINLYITVPLYWRFDQIITRLYDSLRITPDEADSGRTKRQWTRLFWTAKTRKKKKNKN